MKEYGNLIPPEASGFRFPEPEPREEEVELHEPEQKDKEEPAPIKEPEDEAKVPVKEPVEREEIRQGIMSQFRRHISAIALAGMAAVAPGNVEAKPHIEKTKYTEVQKKKSPESLKSYYDKSPEFFRVVPNGEFSASEKTSRTLKLPHGETIFKDIGVNWYQVKKGDSLGKIRANLAQNKGYEYLADQHRKTQSFNLLGKWLRVGRMIPIPMENARRALTIEQVYGYANQSIDEMLQHPMYGEYVKQMLSVMSREELLATVIAIAKKESGGKPLGHDEFHRFESPSEVSLGMHHIVIGKKTPGEKARKNLNFSKGQLYHPINSTKALFGYMYHKNKEFPQFKMHDMFPLTPEKAKTFATFYNGGKWETRNPNYDTELYHHYVDSLEAVQAIEAPIEESELEEAPVVEAPEVEEGPSHHKETKQRPSVKPQRRHEKEKGTHVDYVSIRGGKALYRTILDANVNNGRKTIKSNKQAMKLAKRVIHYLQGTYGDDTYYPGDTVGVGIDKYGPVLVFIKADDGKKAVFRIKN